jgi:DNA-binding CsgD family transcriptional regulator
MRKQKEATRLVAIHSKRNLVERLYAEGKTVRQIADELGISPQGVRYHLDRIFGKKGKRS